MSKKAPPKKEPFHYLRHEHAHPSNDCHWRMCIPVLGTGHITLKDHDLLETLPVGDMMFAHTEYGWIINVQQPNEHELAARGFSPAFINLMTTFNDLGYQHLRLDKDGDTLEGLNRFEW